ncbi:peroxidase family protein [Neorhodopirellula lusitana]|uniref:peroxidase family protein n=1 Tax=Neorhodopirellula lusitana TaxID=445327 RepID=UPI00384FD69A
MARFWNRWTGQSQSTSSKPRKRSTTLRKLKPESLEARQLLAANIFHNELMPEDVNEDGLVSAIDALTIVNRMNEQSRGIETGAGETSSNSQATEQDGRGRRTDVNNDGRDTALDALMVINRLNRERGQTPGTETPGNQQPDFQDGDNEFPSDNANDHTTDPTDDLASDIRSIDGTGNNLANPDYGSADTELLRVADNDYADGISEPTGEDRPSAREISNTLSAADPDGTTNDRNLSSFVFAWGQFLDHDIDLSLEPEDEADAISFDIEVPDGDALFDPFNTGEETISLTRSGFAEGTGTSTDNPAEQVNSITAWVDGSQVYGSDQATSDSLREFVGGRLLITDDGLLPTDENGSIMAGDIRAAENVVLTSMQALFVREHNRLADEISAANPDLTDEEVFQEARTIVIAEMQSITYNEYLPALLGEDALPEYTGYDSSVNPAIANEFSTAAFRFGHTTLNDEFRLVGNDGEDVDEPISLANAFFTPETLEETGIDSFLKYASATLSQEVDLEVVDSLRNFLFGAPGSGGLDLVSLNIQRGRDHGLADFNSTRVAYGLDAAESFADITSDVDVQAKLEALYGTVDNIDLWVGLLAEDHTDDGSLGETATTIIADQFERIRDGDRLFYANTMSNSEIREIENTSLADIIEMNTNLDSLQENVFFFTPEITGTVIAEAATSLQATDAEAATALDETLTSTQRGNRGASPDNNAQDQSRRDQDNPRPDQDESVVSAEGIEVQLLDSEGNLIDTTLTDSKGNYAFDSVTQSGSYQVQIAVSDEWTVEGDDSWDISISNGDEQLRGINFRVLV